MGKLATLESIRDRRATQPPAHFHRNPPGRGQSAVFLRCSLLTYQSRYARRSRLEKQPTDRRRKPCYSWDRTLVMAQSPSVLGTPHQRVDGRLKVTGTAVYAADF